MKECDPATGKMTPAGLYVHVPFCHSKCAYCDFYSTSSTAYRERYVDAVLTELNARRGEIPGAEFRTVYLGGGTPSSLGPDSLARLLEALPTSDAREVTIEVNPEDVTPRLAAVIASSAVNRVSMGVQSLNDEELRLAGRRHSAADAIESYNTLRSAGIENISLDLIFGLPQQTVESFEATLNGIIALQPDHLSAYSLMLEPGTRLYSMMLAGKFRETDDTVSDEMYRLLCNSAAKAGMNHYEISNFAMPGRESLHNSAYWDLTPYIGLGPGAHSFDGITRRYNPPSLKSYMACPAEAVQIDEETPANRINDYIMIRLRTSAGLSLNRLRELFGIETADKVSASAEEFIISGLLRRHDDTIAIPEQHFLVSDTVISALMVDDDC